MHLRDFLRTLTREQREELARKAGTSVAYLYQLAGEHRLASGRMSVNIERATNRAVARRDLRPDLFF